MKTLLLSIFTFLISSIVTAQVSQVMDMTPGVNGSEAAPELIVNGNLIVTTWNSSWTESEVWLYDGTNNPTKLTQINPSLMPGRYVHLLNSFNNKLYYTYGNPSGGYGEGLWEYDFTNPPIKILDSDPTGPELYYNTIVFNNKLYFSCQDATYGEELWSYDGTNTPTMEYELNPNNSSQVTGSYPRNFTIFQNNLYFSAYAGSGNNSLYKFDGTSAPTVATSDLGGNDFYQFPVMNGKLYISKRTISASYFSTCLYEYDGTNFTIVPIPNIGEGQPYYVSQVNTDHFGALYFKVVEYATGQWKNWMYDFTNPAGPVVYNLNHALNYLNESYFYYDDGTYGTELWKYNGTALTRITDLNPNGNSTFTSNPFPYQNKLYFGASDEITGTELWVFDPSLVSINETSLNSLSIYPNPVNSEINVKIDGDLESATIYDLSGNIIESFNSPKYSAEHLTSGMYILSVKTDKGISKTKFIKN